MLYTHATHFVVMGDTLLTGKIARHLGLFGALNVLVGYVVVGNQSDLGRIETLFYADLLEFLNGDGCGNVVGKNEVKVALDQLAGNHFLEPRMGCKDLLCHGHRTWHTLSFINTYC